MSKSDVSSNSEVEDVLLTPEKPNLWNRFKAHMKRFWWAYLIAFCISVLVIILPLFYVGIPNFANDYINKYEYDSDGLEITNPRPTAFHVKQKQTLRTGGGFSGSGHMNAFNATCRVKDTDKIFTTFPVPDIAFGKHATLEIDQDMHLSCVDCMSRLATAAGSNRSSSILIEGSSDLKIGALPTAHLNIHKTMNVGDFINAEGAFNITSIELLDPPVDGYNFNATISVRNPTPFVIELGHVTFNLTMGGSELGWVDLPYLFLEKTNSNAVVLGSVDKKRLIHEALSGDDEIGTVTIEVHGRSCSFKGVDIPYFTAAIKAVSASTRIDLLEYASSLFS
ncbi:Protein of unknown function DUF3712 [Penicillium coprophilum]|uniref:Protein of unknown function DUF3712 n=1 Tax=Penicillium coprophilum TaxID=36646 RepID=UPI0023A51F64|nr:Protein of unknown function DUF3712 [Penicillium coprophilum]KAJ5164098.1 Protein of unknown function DUF3712 [Penicillium coprophilum]